MKWGPAKGCTDKTLRCFGNLAGLSTCSRHYCDLRVVLVLPVSASGSLVLVLPMAMPMPAHGGHGAEPPGHSRIRPQPSPHLGTGAVSPSASPLVWKSLTSFINQTEAL